jgi:adhesin/invasin
MVMAAPGAANAPASAVQVAVNDTARTIRTSQNHTAGLSVVHPGCSWPAIAAAALNQDLSVHTAATPLPAGALIVLFLTGQGPITPALADGTAAPATPLSRVRYR